MFGRTKISQNTKTKTKKQKKKNLKIHEFMF